MHRLACGLHHARAIVAIFFVFLTSVPIPAMGQASTECTIAGFCYCVRQSLKPALDFNVDVLRKLIAEQRLAKKAIGYLSVPISTNGGGYSGVNIAVAAKTKELIEKRFGAQSAWVLDPGTPEADVPVGSRQMKDLVALGANGAEFMYMWTRMLEGANGLGEDFDFFYFVGPSDFGRYFGFTGTGDMAVVDAFFDKRLASDPDFKSAVDRGRTSKEAFRNYYGIRASTIYSLGAHDEWNIARVLNERRRGVQRYGVPNQISVLFDGQFVPMNSLEGSVAPGYVGRCL